MKVLLGIEGETSSAFLISFMKGVSLCSWCEGMRQVEMCAVLSRVESRDQRALKYLRMDYHRPWESLICLHHQICDCEETFPPHCRITNRAALATNGMRSSRIMTSW